MIYRLLWRQFKMADNMTYLTYNSGRPMLAPKIPKLVYMSYCLLTI